MESYMHLSPESEVTLFRDEPLVYASFGERLAAAIIDGLILMVPNFLLQYLAGTGGIVLSLVMGWLYYALMESGTNQATIGKKAMGLKVISENNERLSFGQATGRHFGKIISSIILFIGYLMMLWDAKKQTLHDKMATAFVVKR